MLERMVPGQLCSELISLVHINLEVRVLNVKKQNYPSLVHVLVLKCYMVLFMDLILYITR